MVAKPLFFRIQLSLLLSGSVPHSVPVEALARLGAVRLVAPHAMESRVVAADDALQELVRRLIEVHFDATAVRLCRNRTTDPLVDKEKEGPYARW